MKAKKIISLMLAIILATSTISSIAINSRAFENDSIDVDAENVETVDELSSVDIQENSDEFVEVITDDATQEAVYNDEFSSNNINAPPVTDNLDEVEEIPEILSNFEYYIENNNIILTSLINNSIKSVIIPYTIRLNNFDYCVVIKDADIFKNGQNLEFIEFEFGSEIHTLLFDTTDKYLEEDFLSFYEYIKKDCFNLISFKINEYYSIESGNLLSFIPQPESIEIAESAVEVEENIKITENTETVDNSENLEFSEQPEKKEETIDSSESFEISEQPEIKEEVEIVTENVSDVIVENSEEEDVQPAMLRNSVLRANNSNWYEDFTYTLQNDNIVISKYNGSAEHVDVPATATISGRTYNTVISGEVFREKTIKSVNFEAGIAFTNVINLFFNCRELESINFNGANISGNMMQMFFNCFKLSNIDNVYFNYEQSNNVYHMFTRCESIKELDISNMSYNSSRDIRDFLLSTISLEKLTISSNTRLYDTGLPGIWVHESEYNRINAEYANSDKLNYMLLKAAKPYADLFCPKRYDGDHYTKTYDVLGGTYYRINVDYESLGDDGEYIPADSVLYAAQNLTKNNIWPLNYPEAKFTAYCISQFRAYPGGTYIKVEATNDDFLIGNGFITGENPLFVTNPELFARLGGNMREALIAMLYYGYPNNGSNTKEALGFTTDDQFFEATAYMIDYVAKHSSWLPADSRKLFNYIIDNGGYYNLPNKEQLKLYVYKSLEGYQNLVSFEGVSFEALGGVKIVKTDENNNALAGAVFGIFDENNIQVRTVASGANGLAIIAPNTSTGLKLGRYTVRELEAPQNYVLSNKEFTFEILRDQQVVSVDVNGEKICFVNTNKSGEAVIRAKKVFNRQLKGNDFTFVLKDSEGNIIQTKTNDKDGNVIFDKIVYNNTGTFVYTIEEVVTDDTSIQFDTHKEEVVVIVGDNNSATFDCEVKYDQDEAVFINKSIEHEFSKVDFATNKELPGATLCIIDANGKKIDEWVSTNEPHKITGLKPGTYTYKEIKAPSGYVLSSPVEFTIDNNYNLTGNNTLVNKKSSIIVYKIDSYTNEKMSGVMLQLLNNKKELIEEFISNKNGTTFENLEAGTYYIRETKAPEGYLQLTEDVEFEITDSEDNIEKAINVYNNRAFTVTLSKQDITTKEELPGATLVLTDKDGKKVDEWTSTNEPHVVKNLAPGTYTLTEITAPKGFVKAESITFTVDKDGNITGDTVMYDDYTKLEILKIDASTKKALSGAVLQLLDSNKNIIEEWTTTAEAKRFNRLPVGTYFVREIEAPENYIKLSEDIKVVVTDTTEVIKVEVENTKTFSVELSKQDITTKQELPGATLVLKDKDGKEVEKWISTDKPHTVKNLTPGTYVLTELTAPEGYVKAESITFTIDKNGNITGDTVMFDDYTKLEILKVDSITKLPVSNVKLQLLDSNKKVIEEWITSNNAKRINRLPAGTYFVREVEVPDNYIKLEEDIKITVNNSSELLKVFIENTKVFNVELSKQDITTKEELPGATLVLTDKDGNKVDEWISTNKAHKVKVLPDSYTLTEITAPTGYVKAESITFTVDEEGNVSGDTVMYDDYTKLEILKIDASTKKALSGVKLQLLGKNKNIIEEWTTTTETKHFDRLAVGIYYIHEVSAPEGYVPLKEDIKIEITESTDVVKVEVENQKTYDVELSKKDITSGEELPGATLVLKDKDGNVIEEWVSTDKPHTVKNLAPGTYTLTELTAPAGYVCAETITFTIDKDGNITGDTVMLDDYTKIKIFKVDAVSKEVLNGATLQLLDSDKNLIKEWISTKEGESFEKLPTSIYYIRETKAPEDYVLFEEDIEVEILETSELIKINVYNQKTHSVELSKQDITTKEELEGATLVLTNKDGEKVEEWVSTNEPHKVRNLLPGEYTLTEITAPAGYVKAESIVFTIDETGKVSGDTVMYDDYTKLEVLKIDAVSKEVLSGAVLQLINDKEEVVEEWTTTAEAKRFDRLPVGTYYVREIKAPENYIHFNEDIKVEITESTDVVKVEVENQKTYNVELSKKDITSGEELPGATLVLKDKDGNVIEEWVSTDKPHTVKNLAPGTYTLTELTAPSGFTVAETISFTIDKDGNITGDTVMFDKPTSVKIIKKDAETLQTIENAVLQILDEEKKLIKEFTSTHDGYIATNLPAGTYYIHEVSAPEGYALLKEDLKFVITDKLEDINKEVVVYNTKVFEAALSKQDITTCKELPGATLILKDKDGKEVEKWVSTDKPYVVKNLLPGKYTLTELTAPAGYVKAESITFEVDKEGNVTGKVIMYDDYTKLEVLKVDASTNEALSNATLQLLDADKKVVEEWVSSNESKLIERLPVGKYFIRETKAPEGYVLFEGDIEVEITESTEIVKVKVENQKAFEVDLSKKDITSGEELPGATLVLKDKDGKEVEKWISTNKPHKVKNLNPGKYTLTELTAPAGYVKAETISFEIDKDGKITGDTVMYDDYTKLEILKVDENDVALAGALLKLLDSKGKEVTSWATTSNAKRFERLAPGVYTLVEVSVPKGYLKADNIKIEIREDANVVKVKMIDKFSPDNPPTTPPTTPTNPPTTPTRTPETPRSSGETSRPRPQPITTPVPALPQEVQGVRRVDADDVLGARRGKTGDLGTETRLMIMSAISLLGTLLSARKKKKEL